MKADAFALTVRKGTDNLRADKVTIADAAGVIRFRGVGVVRIAGASLEIDLTVRGSAPPPARHTNVITQKDYWRLTGVIDDDLRFSSEFITPISTHPGFKGVLKILRTLHIVELVTKAVDPAKTRRNQRKRYRRIGVTVPRRKPGNDRSFSFHATFVDHPLPAANAGTEIVKTNDFLPKHRSWSGDTLIGETSVGRYALIQASNGRDLHVHLKSKPDFRSENQEEDQRKFQTLLHALAFTTGIQPWPFRIKYSRGAGYLMSDTLRAPEPAPRTEYVPFRETRGAADGAYLAQAIRVAVDFLEPDTAFNRKLIHVLFLFRQAGSKGVQTEIAVLSVCTLLESLVRAIFKHACGQKSAASEADPRPNMQDMFKAVAQRLALSWKDEMGPIFKEWKTARNPAAHGDFHHEGDQADDEPFLGLSRIAGGFNMILLKLFGYEGPYVASIIEDHWGKIKEM